ncbi:MAG: metallophosphoesterase, partial [Acetatifactor sp.]|nr:metallophosphoesterase [Acetatifactor sp.]
MLNILFLVLVLLIIVMLWVMLYDSRRFVVAAHEIRDRRICGHYRVVFLSDLHNKQFGKNNSQLLEAIEDIHPDAVLVGGDMINGKPGEKLERAVNLLRILKEKYPVYYANGNHEHRIKLYPKTYGNVAERYAAALSELGIVPMINTHVQLPGVNLVIYGSEIDKYFYKRFVTPDMDPEYLPQLLGNPDSGAYTVLLAHNPDYFPRYAGWGADLVLSGHVHGGIIRIPFWGRGLLSPNVRFFPKYDGGVFHEGDSTMILSRGLGS